MKKVLMGVLSLGLLLGAATGCTSDQEKAAGKTKASSEKTEATSGASANGYTDPSELKDSYDAVKEPTIKNYYVILLIIQLKQLIG